MYSYPVTVLHFIVLTFVPFHFFAQPNCTSQINDDYDLNEQFIISKQDKGALTEFSHRLIDDWRGELVLIECKGNIKAPQKIIDSSYADVDIRQHTSERLKIKAELDFRNQNKKMLYVRPFFEQRYIQSYTLNGPDILIFTEKNYQHSHQYGGNTLIETIYKFILDNDTLQLDIITISNGYFSSEERWSLTR